MRNIYRKIRFGIHIAKYLTFRKIVNLVYLALSYLLSMFKIERHQLCMPFFLSVEVANFCNLQCPECTVGINKNLIIKKKTIDSIVYKKIIDELKPTLQHLLLYFQGEPLLNEQLPMLIDYAHRAKIFTSTSTNGQFLTKDNAKFLVLSGLDKIIISIDGTTQKTYEKYRISGSLDKAIEGIKHIVFWKEELKSITPLIEIQFLVLKSNEHQMDEMRQLAKSLKSERLSFKTAQLFDYEEGNELMTSKKRFSRYKKMKNGKFRIKDKQPNRCMRLWTGGVINSHGEVLPCCFDKMSEFSFGNIAESCYSSCLHSKKASGFRENILRNRKQFEICRNCTG